jgi:hypothetical protein
MLRSKVINRGINGTIINIRSMVPAKVSNYRLAFNMRGFPPIEPAMSGIGAKQIYCHMNISYHYLLSYSTKS